MQLGKKVVVFFAFTVSMLILGLSLGEGRAKAVSELLGDEDGFGFGTDAVPRGGDLPEPPPSTNQEPDDPPFTDTSGLPTTITYMHTFDLGEAAPTGGLLVINMAGVESSKFASTVSVNGTMVGTFSGCEQGELGSGLGVVSIFSVPLSCAILGICDTLAAHHICLANSLPTSPAELLADGIAEVTIVNGGGRRGADEVYYDFSQLLVFSTPSESSALTSMWWRSSVMPVSWSRPTSTFWESMIAFSSWP